MSLFIALLFTCGADAAMADAGSDSFQRCAVCHQAGGVGIPGLYPPLANHLGLFTHNAAGRDYLAMVVSGGLAGAITIDNQLYAGVMPNQGGLGDENIAAVLNYVLTNFNKAGLPSAWPLYTTAEVQTIRAAHNPWQPSDGLALRAKALQ